MPLVAIMAVNFDLTISLDIPLIAPAALKEEIPATSRAKQTVLRASQTVRNILRGDDKRILMIVGPCSIHDIEVAHEYANYIKELAEEVSQCFFVVMRAYVEKPRTTTGWKGLIKDPDLNGTGNIEKGLRMARQLMVDLNEMGVPLATEILDPIIPQYIGELLTWGAIGARTVESQTHREIASGLPMALGFKNGTNGNLSGAINAVESARHPHHFPCINQEGRVSILRTRGNPDGHLILRGGATGPNYDSLSVLRAETAMRSAHLKPLIMIDCSHGNSGNDHSKIEDVFRGTVEQILNGTPAIIGIMIESNVNDGSQPLDGTGNLKYGVSISDKCLGWENTERIILDAYQQIRNSDLVNTCHM